MNWTEKQKNQIQQESKKWIEIASDDFESGVILLENEKFHHSCQFLQSSARALMNSYFIIHGMTLPKDDQKRIEQFSELNQNGTVVKEQLAKVFSKIFELEATLLSDKRQIQQYDLLSKQYQKLIYQLQNRFNQLLKNELATLKDQEQFIRHKKQFRRRVTVAVLMVGFIFAGLYWRYSVLNPLHVFNDQGQLFWSSTARTDFSESYQKKFPVKINGQFAEYEISFQNPEKIHRLRLDPLSFHQITQIDLDKIELYNANGEILHVFDFNPEDPPWTRINVRGNKKENGIWTLEPQTQDPFIISTTFPEFEVSTIKIRMRLLEYATFWNWFL